MSRKFSGLQLSVTNNNSTTPRGAGERAGGGDSVRSPYETDSVRDMSFRVSDSGTFRKDEFVISKDGILRSNSKHPRGGRGGDDMDEDDTAFVLAPEEFKELNTCGYGSTGIIKRAVHVPTNVVIALKIINVFDKEKRRVLLKEIRTLYDAQCPNLVSFFGAFYNDGAISIGLEYMDKGSLSDLVESHGRIPEAALGKLVPQMLRGLDYLHSERHVVHRDIKPSNILVNQHGECKVTDFGICADVDARTGQLMTFVGTISYMSPERVSGTASHSYPSDIWSLGVTIYEVATGECPFPATEGPWGLMNRIASQPSPRLPPGRFSPEFEDLVTQCLQKDARDRPTAADLLNHPFIRMNEGVNFDLKSWLDASCARDNIDIDAVATSFLRAYFETFENDRERVALYYREDAIFTIQGRAFYGKMSFLPVLQGIVPGARHNILSVDAQPMGDGAILILCNGQMSIPDDPEPCDLSRAFVIVPNSGNHGNNFWILQDMMKSI